MGPEREACSGLTYFVQAPYTITVCAELSLVHPDPIGDTVHSLDLHSWSKTPHVPDMKDTCCEVHLCVTTKITEHAETILDKSVHSVDALDVPMAPKTQQGLSSFYGNGGSS